MQSITTQPNFGAGMSRRKFLKLGLLGSGALATAALPKITKANNAQSAGDLIHITTRNGKKIATANQRLTDQYFSKTTYEKDFAALADPKNGFEIHHFRGKGFLMKNYEFPGWRNVAGEVDKGVLPKVKGVCNELGAYMAKFMSIKHPDANVGLAVGQEPLYFNGPRDIHVFPIASKKGASNHVVIDPSFKHAGDGYNIQSYRIPPDGLKRFSLTHILSKSRLDTKIAYNRKKSYPMGYIKNLLPKATGANIKSDTLLQMTLDTATKPGKIKLNMHFQNPNGQKTPLKNWQSLINNLPDNNSFKKFINKVSAHPDVEKA